MSPRRIDYYDDPNAPKAALQGWATIENLSGQDWKSVELTLVSGRPVAFHQALYEAYYVTRPEVPVEVADRLNPNVDRGGVAVATAQRERAFAPPPPPAFFAPAGSFATYGERSIAVTSTLFVFASGCAPK